MKLRKQRSSFEQVICARYVGRWKQRNFKPNKKTTTNKQIKTTATTTTKQNKKQKAKANERERKEAFKSGGSM